MTINLVFHHATSLRESSREWHLKRPAIPANFPSRLLRASPHVEMTVRTQPTAVRQRVLSAMAAIDDMMQLALAPLRTLERSPPVAQFTAAGGPLMARLAKFRVRHAAPPSGIERECGPEAHSKRHYHNRESGHSREALVDERFQRQLCHPATEPWSPARFGTKSDLIRGNFYNS